MLQEPAEGNQMRSCVQGNRREVELLRQNTYFFRIECIKRVQCAKYFTFRLFTCFVSNMVQYSRVGFRFRCARALSGYSISKFLVLIEWQVFCDTFRFGS